MRCISGLANLYGDGKRTSGDCGLSNQFEADWTTHADYQYVWRVNEGQEAQLVA